MKLIYKSQVNYISAQADAKAIHFYEHKLRYETDPSDVYADIKNDVADFVILDVRSEAHYHEKHIEGAISLPHARITEKRMSQYPPDTLFIVYCWGPGCNASTKAALKLAQLGYKAKELIGGIEYWEREGCPVMIGEAI